MPNQYKPLPSIEEIGPHIRRYWKMRMTDKQIWKILLEKHVDLEVNGLGLSSFKCMRKSMNLTSTRLQKHTPSTIKPAMIELRELYPLAGAREMVNLLFHEYDMSVSRHTVVKYFRIFESKLVRERKANRLKRRRFWSAGVNDLWAVDQHDKWKKFGLALHTGIDPFPGKIHWVKIWWNNSNPKLILSYYLDAIEKLGYIPLITQSDPGSENYGMANAQSILRQWHDPRLEGTVQHRWMRHKKNIMPEIGWSQLRRRWTPGYETLILLGIVNGWYDPSIPIDAWLFIPWLQKKLNDWVDRINNCKKRADKNKVLPHGPSNDIVASPERYGCMDFKVTVQPEAIDHVRKLYAPRDDPVFQLVPAEFDQYTTSTYEELGSPALDSRNIWGVYRDMRKRLEELHCGEDVDEDYIECIKRFEIQEDLLAQAEVDSDENSEKHQGPYGLIPGKDLAGGSVEDDGTFYMSGVRNGLGLDDEIEEELDTLDENQDDFEFELAADFTDDEAPGSEDDDEW